MCVRERDKARERESKTALALEESSPRLESQRRAFPRFDDANPESASTFHKFRLHKTVTAMNSINSS